MFTPLTKHTKQKKRYTRPARIEAAIESVQADTMTEQRRRSHLTDSSSPDYLPSEVIVHLVRQARRRDDEATMNALLPALLGRCAAILRSRVQDSVNHASTLRDEVLGRFAELFATDGRGSNPDELDYYECKFNRAFMTFRIVQLREEQAVTDPLDSWSDEHDVVESDDPNLLWHQFEVMRGSPATPEDEVRRREMAAAIATLTPDEQQAVILCRYFGYDEESTIPGKVTAATLCDVTGRTIRNRLARALAKLNILKEAI